MPRQLFNVLWTNLLVIIFITILFYLDDIIVFECDVRKTIDALDRNLGTLIDANLKCKPRKCNLFMKSFVYLGYLVSADGISPDPAKIEKVKAWPVPTSGAEVLSFLGLCNYYRVLVPRFAEKSTPLYAIVNESAVVLTAEQLESFENLKEALCSAKILRVPDPTRQFILETDASQTAVGSVLKEKDTDGTEYPVSWYSQSLSKSERNYSTFERELYAVVKSFESFRIYLIGSEFILRTDHRALLGIFNSSLRTSNRVVRWVMCMQPYVF